MPPFDKYPLTPKHFTPKSPLDLIIPLGFDPGNPSSSDLDKPAGVVTNRLHDLNEIDMGRNYYPLKQSANPNLGMEMLQVGNAPKLHFSISGNMVKSKTFNQCSTDLSLTGPSTISSKTCFKPSHNLSNNTEKRSGFDLNLPTAETWDSAMNDFTSENIGTAHTEPVEALAKQGSVSGMIPHGVGSGVIPNGVVSGLVPKGAGNNHKLPNMDMLSEKSSLSSRSEVTLDLQLKLPPRPELRMKNLEIYSSDLSLSLSGKDLNCSPEPVNVKPRPVENSPKIKDKDITNPIAKPVAQDQVIVKQESRDVTLPEKVVQASGLKDQSLASGSVVKKEPVDTTSHAQNPLGIQLDKSPCSGSDSRQAKQAAIAETNSLTKGIDLNSATPLPEVSTSGKLVNPVLAESVVVGQITQSAISQSDAHHDPKKIDNSLAPAPPLVGMDIKPVIISSASPAVVIHDSKRMVSMASDGLSQGSADMDCSEEGQNLPKSVTTGKTIKNTNCETNASSSSSVAINPKQEPGTIGEFDNVRIGGTPRGDNVKSLVPLSTPTSKENQIQIPMLAETSNTQNNQNDIPSSSTKLTDLPNKDMQGLCLDMEAGGSKSRSPCTSISREKEEVDPSSERENGTSSRQTEGNNVLRRRCRRTDLGLDGAQFERRKSRMLPWDEGSNIHSNRY